MKIGLNSAHYIVKFLCKDIIVGCDMKKVRLTKREKFIVAATDPTYEEFATQKEVDRAYKKARGHCFTDAEFEVICAISPTGRREFFEYIWYSWATPQKMQHWWRYTMRCARLWAQGKYKEARELFDKQNIR